MSEVGRPRNGPFTFFERRLIREFFPNLARQLGIEARPRVIRLDAEGRPIKKVKPIGAKTTTRVRKSSGRIARETRKEDRG